MDARFHNPELSWHAERGIVTVDKAEICRRLGPTDAEVTRLSGGLANDTFRIGPDRVLRIYRRDASSIHREKSLLLRNWQRFQVPQVISSGDDFLVLDYVEHGPLLNIRAHGVAVGVALAEIHNKQFTSSGLFGKTIALQETWDDFPRMMQEYLTSQADSISRHAAFIQKTANWIESRESLLRNHCANPVLLHGDFKVSNIHWSCSDQLLVLDWEFTYAGPALLDIGQLIRWGISEPFRKGFEYGYLQNNGYLPAEWEQISRWFDLVNLVGLLAKSHADSQQALDCRLRIEQILSECDGP